MQEDASGSLAVDFRDPAGFACRIVVLGEVGNDPGDQGLEVGIPAELPVVDFAVRHDHPPQIAGMIRAAYNDLPFIDGLRHGVDLRVSLTDTLVSVAVGYQRASGYDNPVSPAGRTP